MSSRADDRPRKRAQEWQKHFDALAPKVGDIAPDFELRDVNDQNPIRLTDFRGRMPVVLIFGSYT